MMFAVGKTTGSLLACVAILLAAEGVARSLETVSRRETHAIFRNDRHVVINVGTSRTHQGVSPRLVEEELILAGVSDPWVANVYEKAATMTGELLAYEEKIHPWAKRTDRPGVIAIEVRGSGMNDNYMLKTEAARVERASGRDGIGDIFAPGGADALANRLIGTVHLSRGFSHIARLIRHATEETSRTSSNGTLVDYIATFSWGQGDRGFESHVGGKAGWRAERWKERYQGGSLRNYVVGGRQTEALRTLIRLVKSDRWKPVLYVMPLSDIHLGFYGEGDYDRFLDTLRSVANTEQVGLVDFGEDGDFDRSLFRDTNHLNSDGAAHLAGRFARRVALPLLR